MLRDALRKRTRKVRGSGTELSDVEARAAPNQEAAVLSCTKAGWQPMARLVVTKVREVNGGGSCQVRQVVMVTNERASIIVASFGAVDSKPEITPTKRRTKRQSHIEILRPRQKAQAHSTCYRARAYAH